MPVRLPSFDAETAAVQSAYESSRPRGQTSGDLRLVERLKQQADDVARLTSGLGEAALAARTVAGKWSLKELVCHLWRVQQVFEGRIEAMLAQEHPAITIYDPDTDDEFEKLAALPADQLRVQLSQDRARLATRLETLSPVEWHRSGRHPEYPHYDIHFQVEYMVHHEAHHLYQMYQRRALLGKLPH